MIIDFLKKYKLYILLSASFIVLYIASFCFLLDNHLGRPVLEVDIFNDASLWQIIVSTLYTAFIFTLFHLGKKLKKELFLKLTLIQSAIMFLIPLICIFFLLFGFETELGALIFAYIMLFTMAPFLGYGIHLFVVFLIPAIGILLFILSKTALKKL